MLSLGLGITVPRFRASGFNPAAYGTVAAWYDFSDVVTLFQNNASATTPVTADDDLVGTVVDKSGNGRDIHSGTDAPRPTYKLAVQNGLAGIRSDGSKVLQSGAFTLDQPATIFLVAKRSSATQLLTLFDGRTNLSALIDKLDSGTDWMIYSGSAFVQGGTADTAWHLFTAVFAGASSLLRVDGTQVAAGNPGATNLGGVTVGMRGGFSAGCPGDYGELIPFAGTVAGDELAAVETYLRTKWGTP